MSGRKQKDKAPSGSKANVGRKKVPSTKPANVYKREVTAEKKKVFSRQDIVEQKYGESGQVLSKFHEQAYRKLVEKKVAEQGVKTVAESSKVSMSRLGSAIFNEDVHEELTSGSSKEKVKVSVGKDGAEKTHLQIPKDKEKLSRQTYVSLRKKGKGNKSSTYPAMVDKGVHPVEGKDTTHEVLTTHEALRQGGRDIADVLAKKRLVSSGKMSKKDAIAPDKRGSFELPGAQQNDPKIQAILARNTGRTLKEYSRESPERGAKLDEAVSEINQLKQAGKTPGYHTLKRGSEVLTAMEEDGFDSPRTPPQSPQQKDAYRDMFNRSPSRSPEPLRVAQTSPSRITPRLLSFGDEVIEMEQQPALKIEPNPSIKNPPKFVPKAQRKTK